MINKPGITVIVPTAGQRIPELVLALQSIALQETDEQVEIVVADDSAGGLDEDEVRMSTGNTPVRIVRTFGQPSANRQLAVDTAQGGWVAFLDDDDVWEKNKLQTQVSLARQRVAEGFRPVVSCRFRHKFEDSDAFVTGLPARLIAPQERVEDYLFIGRRPSVRRPSIFTSTIFTSQSLVKEVPWRRVKRHQDWDWLVRVGRVPTVQFVHCPEELVTIAVGSAGSISAKSDWRSSFDWARDALYSLPDQRAYTDFLVAQPLRYALQARDLSGVRSVLVELGSIGCRPSASALATGLAGIANRRVFQKAMSIGGRREAE